jgi:hypothetical protein
MILPIERTKFTYLYKYNQVRVDINQLIDKPIDKLLDMQSNELSNLVLLFNKTIPLFEQEHEIILLEIDKSKIIFQDGILISFDSIQCIYPLTKIGLQLLDGKINDDFIIAPPVFENSIEALRLKRSMAFRKATAEKLLLHYNLNSILNKTYFSLIESAIEKNLLEKSKPQFFDTFLDYLVAYNKTPSYIPDGNIEYICKIGAIAIKYLRKSDEVFTNGPFYKSSIKYKSKISNCSYLTSYLDFISISDIELKSSIEKMVEKISKDYSGIDIFKVSYFYLAFKSFLNKNDNNIELLNNEIEALKINDMLITSFVLAMIGYTFSFENIYEGLHKLSNASLLKSTNIKILKELECSNKNTVLIEKNNEIEKTSFEQQDNINLKQVNLKDEIQIENNAKDILINNEIFNEGKLNNSIELVSKPIVIYENTDKIVGFDNVDYPKNDFIETITETGPNVLHENVGEDELAKNEKSTIDDYANVNKESEIDNLEGLTLVKEILTVQNFKVFLSKEQTKTKQKMWYDFLDIYFPNKYDEITLENIVDILDRIPEVKVKLLKTKKDEFSIKSFFDYYKK